MIPAIPQHPMVQVPVRPYIDLSADLAACGWRFETIVQPDGSQDTIQIPLTPEEFLHPQEGYHLPNSTFHDRTTTDAKDMLQRRYEQRSDVGVFSDLLIRWPNQEPKDCCPDVAVVFGLSNPAENRERFIVETEAVRPVFVLEVVSPRYRKQDRENKVTIYAQAQVQEYAIIDRRSYRGQILEEVLGYRLIQGHYEPITPDEEGRVRFETIGLWISLRDGQLVLEDIETGERLKTARELNADLAKANQRAAELEAMLARYQSQFGNLEERSPDKS